MGDASGSLRFARSPCLTRASRELSELVAGAGVQASLSKPMIHKGYRPLRRRRLSVSSVFRHVSCRGNRNTLRCVAGAGEAVFSNERSREVHTLDMTGAPASCV